MCGTGSSSSARRLRPEKLKASLGGTFESIGRALAIDCRDNTTNTWNHPHLQHNAAELERLRNQVRGILFN